MKDQKKLSLDNFEEKIVKIDLSEKVYGGNSGYATSFTRCTECFAGTGYIPCDEHEYGDWISTC